MKKSLFIITLILVLIPFLLLFSSCQAEDNKIIIEKPTFKIQFYLNESTLEATCEQEITVQDSIVPIQFYPIYQSIRDNIECYEIGEITVDNKTSEYDIDKTNHCIIPKTLPAIGKRSTICIRYKIMLSEGDYRLGINNRCFALTRAYPYVAYYNSGYQPRPFSEIGESESLEIADFEVSLKAKNNMVIASSGSEINCERDGDYSTSFYELENVRDFALFCSPYFTLRSQTIGDTIFRYYFQDDKSYQANITEGIEAYKLFSTSFSDYGYDSINIVRAPLSSNGMEYSCLCAVNEGLPKTQEGEVIAHEIAHQWWFLKVGNDQAYEPWLDESLAEFSTLYYLLKRGGGKIFQKRMENAYNIARLRMLKRQQLKVNLSVYDYNAQDYVDCVYTIGALLWVKLYEQYGMDLIDELKGYALENSLKIATKNILVSTIKEGTLKGYFQAWLEGKVAFVY